MLPLPQEWLSVMCSTTKSRISNSRNDTARALRCERRYFDAMMYASLELHEMHQRNPKTNAIVLLFPQHAPP